LGILMISSLSTVKRHYYQLSSIKHTFCNTNKYVVALKWNKILPNRMDIYVALNSINRSQRRGSDVKLPTRDYFRDSTNPFLLSEWFDFQPL
jgi:hypothetical protein